MKNKIALTVGIVGTLWIAGFLFFSVAFRDFKWEEVVLFCAVTFIVFFICLYAGKICGKITERFYADYFYARQPQITFIIFAYFSAILMALISAFFAMIAPALIIGCAIAFLSVDIFEGLCVALTYTFGLVFFGALIWGLIAILIGASLGACIIAHMIYAKHTMCYSPIIAAIYGFIGAFLGILLWLIPIAIMLLAKRDPVLIIFTLIFLTSFLPILILEISFLCGDSTRNFLRNPIQNSRVH